MQDIIMQGEPRSGRELLGLPVYTITDGRHLGEIDGLLVRREDCSIGVVRIRPVTGKRIFLLYEAIKTVGVDIALVEHSEVLNEEVPPEVRNGLEMNLPGRQVLTQGGESAGHIVSFGVDTASSRIVSFRIEANTGFLGKIATLGRDRTVEVPTAMVISLGPDAVIVQDSVKELLNPSHTEAAIEPQKI